MSKILPRLLTNNNTMIVSGSIIDFDTLQLKPKKTKNEKYLVPLSDLQVQFLIDIMLENIKENKRIEENIVSNAMSITTEQLFTILDKTSSNTFIDKVEIISNFFSKIRDFRKEHIVSIFNESTETKSTVNLFSEYFIKFFNEISEKTDIKKTDLIDIFLDVAIPFIFEKFTPLENNYKNGYPELSGDAIKVAKKNIFNDVLIKFNSFLENEKFNIPEEFLKKYMEYFDTQILIGAYSMCSEDVQEELKKIIIKNIENIVKSQFHSFSNEELSMLDIKISIGLDEYVLFSEINEKNNLKHIFNGKAPIIGSPITSKASIVTNTLDELMRTINGNTSYGYRNKDILNSSMISNTKAICFKKEEET